MTIKRLAVVVDGEVVIAIPLPPMKNLTDDAVEALLASDPKVVITDEVISAGHLWDGTSFTLPSE